MQHFKFEKYYTFKSLSQADGLKKCILKKLKN